MNLILKFVQLGFVLALVRCQILTNSNSNTADDKNHQQAKYQQQSILPSTLSQPPASHPSSSSSKGPKSLFPCSRAHSKFVREYFARELLPIYQKYRVPVSNECPFSPLNDVYHHQENNKSRIDSNKWKCDYCGKLFSSEYYLDKHYDSRHNHSLNLTPKSVCLASYCRIFRCDALMKSPIIEKAKSIARSQPQKCYESIMDTLRTRCQTFVETCIPSDVNYQIRNKLTYELKEALCSYITCTKYQQQPAYMSKGPSFFYIFVIVMIAVISIITYGVLNHTDLVFDENEVIQMNNETEDILRRLNENTMPDTESTATQGQKGVSPSNSNQFNASRFTANTKGSAAPESSLRQRATHANVKNS